MIRQYADMVKQKEETDILNIEDETELVSLLQTTATRLKDAFLFRFASTPMFTNRFVYQYGFFKTLVFGLPCFSSGITILIPFHLVAKLQKEAYTECILEPLSLPESPGGVDAVESSPYVPCIFCKECYVLAEQNQLLKHMIIEHKLVIADVKLVADFRSYILYWKRRFAEQPITDFCSVIRTNSKAPLEEQENYFLLCDVLPEDRLLREQLQQKRLREILEQQQQERYDTSFHSMCMFCDQEFTGNRSVLLNHMAREHAFNIGLPDNIVNCYEFLAVLQGKLDNLQCLYCEKVFRDKNTLKDHMRKKQHRRINAKNKEYDKFYIINYLEFGKSWEEVQSEDDRELLDNLEEYYFPTYENDTLLCTLSDSEDAQTEDQSEEVPVVSEDVSSLKALKQSSVLNQLLCKENKSPEKF
ncbi:zinc finger protein [Turdus rufiventris]|nr:zinc finger protein [Turdus rufiventris]